LQTVLPAEAGQVTASREVTGRRKDGTELPIEVSIGELGSDSRPRLVAILRDVTERKRKEEDLRQAQRMEAVGTLASGIAHDFNNLLMGIAGAGYQALRNLDLSHPSHAPVSRAIDATMRGASLTRQLLSFGDKRRATAGPVELDAVVAGAKDLIGRLVGDHIRLTVETHAPGLTVIADPGDIEQILMNLATNARDAMPSGGELTVRTHVLAHEGGSQDDSVDVLLSVEDTGVGMDAATSARVFEPFFTTKEIGQGTGLGLSTVFAVATRLGGAIGVDSEVGRGTKLTLRLRASARHAANEIVAVASALSRGSERVLVVEDDAMVRMAVESFLQSLGYRPTVAASPEEAIELCAQPGHEFDVLLTDVMMPGRLGGDLARELRIQRPGLRTLFMSAHPSEELVRLGRLEPNAALLNKPFSAQALGLALRRLVGSTRPAWPRALRVLVVDDNTAVADMLGEVFRDHSPHVAAAYTGERAVELAADLLPEVVVCDIDLGHGMSGYDVAETLKQDPRMRGTYLIALTGLHVNDCRIRASVVGFDEILSKPVNVEKLLASIALRASLAAS
jgi:two-component system cell cycle sensor histidine kinase/response regulator CckA